MRKLVFLLVLPFSLSAQDFSKEEIARWQQQAKQVTIIRDNYGIPHIYGKTDADAVFGLMYAQCEDDFKRVETNYIEKLGNLSKVKGESAIFDDLLMQIVIDQDAAKDDYNKAPAWLKKLCDAYAAGINYYLYKHPDTKPALLKHFEPWFPLLWTDGSIGAINTAGITADDVKNLYTGNDAPLSVNKKQEEEELTGSNGFAFSPKITESGNAILYINPHVTFYFRPEVHVVSDEGLNAYGAVTWGQFFVYQGFNAHCGWMHTSSQVDAADSYIENLVRKNDKWFYSYNGNEMPVKERKITIEYKLPNNSISTKLFTVLYTGHGPVMARRNKQWLSVRADNRIMNGLIQCWQRTKTNSFADFKKTLDLLGNISNNTVYADAEGNIAYWHGNRIPARDAKIDWDKPVDGTTSATEWRGYHKVNETVHVVNPLNGWLQNCNSTPFTVAGDYSPLKNSYPAYMAPDGENFRGINAVRVLSEQNHYTIDKVIKAGYDNRLSAFEILIPALVKSFDQIHEEDSLRDILNEPIQVLKEWDYRCSESSVATTLAVEWGQRIQSAMFRTKVPYNDNPDQVDKAKRFAAVASVADLLPQLATVVNDLQKRFGHWQVPWGEINRFQRISPDIENKFDDSKESLPVAFTSSAWGMLPSFTSRVFPGTKKRYGYNGNSFICVVEFGKRIKAKSLLTGGESGDPGSKHFADQAEMYTRGQFKDVLFYKEDVLKHAERTYHPGE